MTNPTEKTVKPQGIIRWNAIVPVVLVCVLVFLYTFFFFDLHMKKAIEWIGYKSLGAEVNVGEFKSSFLKGQVSIKKIELTNSEKPEFNSLELGDVKFDLNWNALLRVKFVIEEIAVEGVQFMSKREHPGKVAPPEPEDNKPGFAQQLKQKALNKLEGENENNILGDTAQFLKTGKFDDQIKSMQSQIASKKLLENINAKWAAKRTEWDSKIKALPSSDEINSLKDRLSKIKFSNFTSIQELDSSLKEADSVVKELDTKNRQIQDLRSQFDGDIKSVDQDYKSIDLQIKKDIEGLKSRFKVPKIDAGSFAKALFMGYLTPITEKVDRYRKIAEKYLPPKYAKMVAGEKSKNEDDSATIQPHPRSDGVTYEFPAKYGFPLFWIQRIKLSSKSNAQTDYGDFNGLIANVTSNQNQTGLPTTAEINGDFNKFEVKGIKLNATLNNIPTEAEVKFVFDVGSYPIKSEMKLIDSKDGSISIPQAAASFSSSGTIAGFKTYDFKLTNVFDKVNFKVTAGDKTISDILNSTLGTINKFDLQASAKGELSNLDIDIRSSLAGDLERAFQALLQTKIKEANEQLQKAISGEVDKLKASLNTQVNALKAKGEGEIKKVQGQVDEQKKLADTKVASAKKEFDDRANKAKKDAEDQAKKKLEQEGGKQVDDLKKRLGL